MSAQPITRFGDAYRQTIFRRRWQVLRESDFVSLLDLKGRRLQPRRFFLPNPLLSVILSDESAAADEESKDPYCRATLTVEPVGILW